MVLDVRVDPCNISSTLRGAIVSFNLSSGQTTCSHLGRWLS